MTFINGTGLSLRFGIWKATKSSWPKQVTDYAGIDDSARCKVADSFSKAVLFLRSGSSGLEYWEATIMSGLTLQQTIYICEPDELRKPKRSLREKDCVANLLGRDLVALPPSENCAMSQLGVRVDTLYRSSSFVVNLE